MFSLRFFAVLVLEPKKKPITHRNQSHTTSKYQFPTAQRRSSLVSHYWPVTFVFRFASLFRTPFVSPSQSVFSGFHSLNSPHFVIPDSVRFSVSVHFSGLLRNREFPAHQAFSRQTSFCREFKDIASADDFSAVTVLLPTSHYWSSTPQRSLLHTPKKPSLSYFATKRYIWNASEPTINY